MRNIKEKIKIILKAFTIFFKKKKIRKVADFMKK